MTKTLTRSEIAESIYLNIGFSKVDASRLIDQILNTITDRLAAGEKVKISSFGTFDVRSKPARVGRNFKTGSATVISARKVVSFKASQLLKDRVEGR